MGGFGSGRWYRYNKATTTDDVRSIDVRELRKWGCLPDRRQIGSQCGSLKWYRREEVTASVGYVIHADRLNLSFRHKSRFDYGENVEQTVWFDRTTCNFGGERLWFQCPRCGTSIAVLYYAGAQFLCRHC